MRKALVVGIDEYPNGNALHGCVNDAVAMKKVLEFDENGDRNFDVIMKNNVTTSNDLTTLIRNLFSGDSDVGLFYFSGHGFINELGGYLVTPDSNGRYDIGVSLSNIICIANMSSCKNKIIILDSCFSGGIGQLNIINSDLSSIGKGVTILTSSKENETSMEINGHGLFTSLLLEGLNGGAANLLGYITPGSVYSYIDQALGAWDQRPLFKTNIQSFVPLRKVDPRVTKNELRNIKKYFEVDSEVIKLDPSYESTNKRNSVPTLIKPHAIDEHVEILTNLQKLEGVGLVEPVGEDHMYFAAMHSKGCKLTTLGKYYWQLLNKNRI